MTSIFFFLIRVYSIYILEIGLELGFRIFAATFRAGFDGLVFVSFVVAVVEAFVNFDRSESMSVHEADFAVEPYWSSSGWRLVRVNPITRAESDTILGCPIVFGHHKLSDSSDPGRVRTQPSQNQSGSDRASEPHDEIG
jgi:hypothetical protein